MSDEKIKADIKRIGEWYIKALDGGKFNADSTIQFNAELTGKSMSERPTPETDAIAAHEGNWDTKALRMTNHARRLERERDEAREALEFRRGLYKVQEAQLNEAREKLARITEAASAVVDRWEQPVWKDTVPTATVIYRLRDALGRGQNE